MLSLVLLLRMFFSLSLLLFRFLSTCTDSLLDHTERHQEFKVLSSRLCLVLSLSPYLETLLSELSRKKTSSWNIAINFLTRTSWQVTGQPELETISRLESILLVFLYWLYPLFSFFLQDTASTLFTYLLCCLIFWFYKTISCIRSRCLHLWKREWSMLTDALKCLISRKKED